METQKEFNTLDIFIYLWKKRKPIIIITLVGAFLSVGVSLLLKNYYKASAVLFPSSFVSTVTGTIRHINQETDPLLIGDEDDLERMMQLLKSDYITNRLIQKYDLINHYGIAPEDKHAITKVKEIYEDFVTIKKTPYLGVLVEVVDSDPLIATAMVNEMTNLLDTLVFEMRKDRATESYEIAKNLYEIRYKELKQLEDSLDMYRQLGVLDYYIEVERYSEAYGKAIGANTLTARGQAVFDKKFDILKKYGKAYYSLTGKINNLTTHLQSIKMNMDALQQNILVHSSFKYVISQAQVPDKKAFPKRSIIVVFSTLGAFVFAIAMILLLDFYYEIRKKIKEIK